MLQILKDIAGNRMPSVADLLKDAAAAPSARATESANRARMAGQVRGGARAAPGQAATDAKKAPSSVPQILDQESSQQPADENATLAAANKSRSSPRLTLPVTTLAGKPGPGEEAPEPPASQKMDEAVTKQQDLLAEFDKIADELNRVLANLEGSTLVKRLK